MSNVITRVKPKVKTNVKLFVEPEQQVIVHCSIQALSFSELSFRIWPSTFLVDHDSAHRSKLLHNENIPLAPAWKNLPAGSRSTFTLIFSALPKGCRKFDLKEVIPTDDGFIVESIARNKMDVYYIDISHENIA